MQQTFFQAGDKVKTDDRMLVNLYGFIAGAEYTVKDAWINAEFGEAITLEGVRRLADWDFYFASSFEKIS